MQIEGFEFEPPPGFRTEEATIAYRMGLPGSGPGPSVIIQSKLAQAGATLADLAKETLAELGQTIPHLKNASQAELKFADGGVGTLFSYTFNAQTGELRQYFALRLDKGRLCMITLTVPTQKLTESSARTFISAIASVKPR